jgi:hypothetical protein
MASRSAKRVGDITPRRSEGRALVHLALGHAIRQVGASRAECARWMGVAESTLTRWLQKSTPVLVEAVLSSRRLRRPFATCLAVLASRSVRRNGRNHG